MAEQNQHITEKEFITFLRSLSVETFDNNFEWMLSDPKYEGFLKWIYENLDENNALTAREEYRYSQLEKQGKVLSPEGLEAKLRQIQDEFKGLCLPGDQEGLEDVKLGIRLQKQNLAMLENEEETLKKFIQEYEEVNQNFSVELIKLDEAEKQAVDEEKALAEECMKLAQQAEVLTSDTVDIVADALNVYSSCAGDKEASKRFFTYGPFDSYKQTHDLFKSQFDLFTTLKFDSMPNDGTDDEVMLEAKRMEDRLSDAIDMYIESKAELDGVQARLNYIANFDVGHPRKYGTMELNRSAIQMLEQEESILEQQIQIATKQFVERRTSLTVDNIARSTLAARELIYKDLTFVKDIASESAALDRLLYSALRRELHSASEFLNFASHLRDYLLEQTELISSRIKAMNEICIEQDQAELKLQYSNILLRNLYSILKAEPNNDVLIPELNLQIPNDLLQSVFSVLNTETNNNPLKSNLQISNNDPLKSESNLQTSNDPFRRLFSIPNVNPNDDFVSLILNKLYNDMLKKVQESKDEILNGFKIKKAALDVIENQAKPLHKLIWNGPTKKPNCYNTSLSIMNHQLTQEIAKVEARVNEISELLETAMSGDEHKLRKLWQYFLVDPKKFLAFMTHMRN